MVFKSFQFKKNPWIRSSSKKSINDQYLVIEIFLKPIIRQLTHVNYHKGGIVGYWERRNELSKKIALKLDGDDSNRRQDKKNPKVKQYMFETYSR